MESNIVFHSIGAYMFFAGAPFIFSFYTVIFTSKGIITTHHVLIKYTTIYVILSIISIPISMMMCNINGIPIADMLGSMDPSLGINRAMEWLLIYFFFGWLFITGMVFLKNSKKNY